MNTIFFIIRKIKQIFTLIIIFSIYCDLDSSWWKHVINPKYSPAKSDFFYNTLEFRFYFAYLSIIQLSCLLPRQSCHGLFKMAASHRNTGYNEVMDHITMITLRVTLLQLFIWKWHLLFYIISTVLWIKETTLRHRVRSVIALSLLWRTDSSSRFGKLHTACN